MSKIAQILITTAFIASFVLGCSKNKSAEVEKNKDVDRIYTVTKKDMHISTLLTGSVNSQKKYKLYLEPSLRTTLSWIVDENSFVKKGDPVIKFDGESLEQKIEDLKVEIDSKEKALIIEEEKKRILESENKEKIRVAIDGLESAKEALGRYIKYDGKRTKKNYELAISNAKKAYTDNQKEYYKKTEAISNKIYDDDQAAKEKDDKIVSDLKQKLVGLKTSYNNAKLDLKVFKRYTYPNKLSKLENSLAQQKLNLDKVKVSTSSRMIQQKNTIVRIQKTKKKIVADLDRVVGYLEKMVIKAPVDGVLVYGDIDRKRGKIEIKVGMDVRRKQVLATIPDMNNLIVDFELPEQFRHKVNIGDKVIISPDSIPNLKVFGKVSKIAMIPVNQIYWDANSPKIYSSKIILDTQSKQLVSGMNVQIEIITEVIKNTLFIPLEAVFEENGEYYIYLDKLLKPQKTPIKVGKSNENYVQILDGLSEGDKVYLYRPFTKED